MTKTLSYDRLSSWASDEIGAYERQVEDFKKTIEKNGICYALSWSQNTFKAAAFLEFAQTIQAQVKHVEAQGKGTEVERCTAIVRHWTNECVRKARWPEHSTSATSNLIAEFRTAAMAEFASKFDDLD
jgi:hypothetical protein